MPLQTFRYAACGGANTSFDIVLYSFFYNIVFAKQDVHLGLFTLSGHIASIFPAFCISFCTGFYLNRFIVFKESGLRKRTQLSRFVLLNAICICLNAIFMKIFVDGLGLYPTPGKIATTILVIGISYTLQTYVFFKQKESVILTSN
ncbi:GtrA family protein [Mucilaginibacter myungsuensis]|uniref:GtrA family protein n=2 Tax=Mucilaginibacter myungsuensis TaxID=649104 RepID=A0A929KXV6_9SPHI|nr:GtrA family protein [Mucilaginibacter myungsuensis]